MAQSRQVELSGITSQRLTGALRGHDQDKIETGLPEKEVQRQRLNSRAQLLWTQEIAPYVSGFEVVVKATVSGAHIVPGRRDAFFDAYQKFQSALRDRLEEWKRMHEASKAVYLDALNQGHEPDPQTLVMVIPGTVTAVLRKEHARVLEHPALAGYMAAEVHKTLQRWANFIETSPKNRALREAYSKRPVPQKEQGVPNRKGHREEHPEVVWPAMEG